MSQYRGHKTTQALDLIDALRELTWDIQFPKTFQDEQVLDMLDELEEIFKQALKAKEDVLLQNWSK